MKFFNRIKLTTSYFLGRSKVWGMPVEASIEITTRCNLACLMCPRGKINRPIKDMSWPVFKKVIAEIKDYAELVYLHGLGEPLLNKNLFKMIAHAKKQGLPVGISTNAAFLDKEKAGKLLNSGIDYVIFAIDAATKKTYEKVRVGGNFKRVEQNIKNFLQMKKKSKRAPFVVLQFITMPENENEANSFLEKWRYSGAEAVRVKPVVDFFGRRKPKRVNTSLRCLYPYRMVNVYYDGTVVPCCQDNFGQYVLGNIKEKSLREIWNGPRAQRLRRKLAAQKRNEVSLCRQCRYPQPSAWGILGVTLFDNLKVKKILPFLERLPIFRERMIIYE